jgi:hypothetical protein
MTEASTVYDTFERNSQTAQVDGLVKIPHHAVGVTVSPIEPFTGSVQVSWLQPVGYDWSRGSNELRINETRRPITDDGKIEVPKWAYAPSVFEPPGSDESIIYWLG